MTIVIPTTVGDIAGARFRTLDVQDDGGTWSVVAVLAGPEAEIAVSDGHADEPAAIAALEQVVEDLAAEGDIIPDLVVNDIHVLGTLSTAFEGQDRIEIGTDETHIMRFVEGSDPVEESPSISVHAGILTIEGVGEVPVGIQLDATQVHLLAPVVSLGVAGAIPTALQMVEHTSEPAAPAANCGLLFLDDNGSGKTRLRIKFSSGAAQTIATQP